MSTNRNAVLRYNTLDKCFSNFGRRYYFKDLLDKVNDTLSYFDPSTAGIKTRQLRDDIRFMKSDAGYSAPIEAIKDGKMAYYRYHDKNFSINNSPLNSTEAEQLKNAISVLQRFEGAPQFEWINELAPMLTDHFGLLDSTQKVISFDTNIDYTGYDKIQPLFNAIVNKLVLEIEYEPFDQEAFTFKFHPYQLKQYNNRWFVFGLNKILEMPRWNMALDRINSIKEINDKYIDLSIDWDDHFYDIIGVSTPEPGNVEEVEVIFAKEQAKYIQTKPLHPSQRASLLENGKLQVKLSLIINFELEMAILSFGERIEVIKPKTLRVSINKRLKDAVKKYI